MSKFDLNGRIILLTGAAGYLGSAMAKAILEAGGDVIMTGRSEDDLLRQRAEFNFELQNRCHVLVCDIISRGASQHLYEEIFDRFGKLHGIVNNAYAGKVGTIDQIDLDDFILACTYNLAAPFEIIKNLSPLLEDAIKQDKVSTSIVNIASMYGIVSPDPSLYLDSGKNNPVHYGASKGGMIQMTRYLACHLGERGIRVNSISPGAFPNTEFDPGIPGFYEKLAKKVPLKRVGRPHEVGGAIVFLLSDAASYVNGANLAIDGGWTAW